MTDDSLIDIILRLEARITQLENHHHTYSNFDGRLGSKIKIKKTTNLILKEISNLKTKKISDNELLKGKNMIIGDYFRYIDDSLMLHTMLAVLETLVADEYAIPKYLEKIKLVSSDDLIEVANKYLEETKLSKAILTPEKHGNKKMLR